MSIHRKVPEIIEVVNGEPVYGEPEQEKTSAESKADAFAEALKDDSDAFINVHRQTMGGNSPMEFINRFPADKYDLGQLQLYLAENYGGGDYRIMLYAKGKVRANKLLSIARKIEPGTNAISATSEAAGILNTVLERMERQNNLIIQMMQNQNKAPDRMEMLNEMMLMKQLFDNGSSGNGISQLKDSIEMLSLLGVEIGQQKSDDEGGFGTLIEKFVPVFEAAAKQPNQQPQYKQNPESRKQDMNFKIKMAIQMALRAAAQNSDPAVYATMLVDNLGEEKTKELLTDSAIGEKLIKMAPPVANYAQWFDDLIEHAKAMIGLESRFSNLYLDPDSDISPGNKDFQQENNGSDNGSTFVPARDDT